MKKDNWKNYLNFSRRERAALLLLAFIAVLLLLLPRFAAHNGPLITVDTAAEKQLALLSAPEVNRDRNEESNDHSSAPATTPSVHTSLFRFDPNTLDEAGWQQLGISPNIIRIIRHYREKGGRFRRPSDLAKIYGLKPADAERLIPYVRINEPTGQPPVSPPHSDVTSAISGAPPPAVLDINTATAEQWEALPGIGPVLANRIVKFRYKLGGFNSIEQLKQTYGLTETVVEQLRPYLRLSAQKININTASASRLVTEGHIPPSIAGAILSYRRQHGAYASVSELKKIPEITDSLFTVISPFLGLEGE